MWLEYQASKTVRNHMYNIIRKLEKGLLSVFLFQTFLSEKPSCMVIFSNNAINVNPMARLMQFHLYM